MNHSNISENKIEHSFIDVKIEPLDEDYAQYHDPLGTDNNVHVKMEFEAASIDPAINMLIQEVTKNNPSDTASKTEKLFIKNEHLDSESSALVGTLDPYENTEANFSLRHHFLYNPNVSESKNYDPTETLKVMNDESDEEDVSADIDELYFTSQSSSDESGISDVDEIGPSKRKRVEPRLWVDSEFCPTLYEFDARNSGIMSNVNITDNADELEFFEIFFNKTIMSIIVDQTNKYASKLRINMCKTSKMNKWVNSTVKEMYIFLATILLMDLLGKNSLKKYWSNNPIIDTPFIKILFSQDRFLLLLRALHFADNDATIHDRLHKIRNILDPLKKIYKSTFYPFQNLCVDEKFLSWKRRLAFKIYSPSKQCTFSIKLFVCCDVQTGYVLDVIVYTGPDSDIIMNENIGVSGSLVTTILQDYLGKGHRIFVDKQHTNPALFDFLYKNKTNACGIARRNQKGMPNFGQQKLKRGDMKCFNSNNLLAIKWKDKREIIILTNCHTNKMVVTNKTDHFTKEYKRKPEAAVDYSKNIGAVNKLDRILGFVNISRKPFKWYKTLFFRLLDISTQNAFFLHRLKTSKKHSFSDFRENLIKQLVEKYHTERPSTSGGRKMINCPTRLTDRHFVHPVPQTQAQGRRTQRKCHVCAQTTSRPKKRKDTKYMCIKCNVALCLYPCFEDFHTKKNY